MAKELVSLAPQFHIPRHFLPPSTLSLRPKPPQNPIFTRRLSHINKTSSSDDGIPANEVKTIAKFKSRHNYIRVIEVSRRTNHPLAGSRLLLLDNPGNIHSISFLLKSLTDSYFDVFATLPPIIPEGPIGILGFGAGSTARLILDLYPPEITIHGWEIDPSVIDVGREFFNLSKLERDHKGRVFINIGDALNASVRTGFSGILVDLFSRGSVIKELQDPNVWERLKTRLRKRGRIMVNVGGRCVEAEDSERDGDLVMVETLKAMSQVFGDKLFVLTLGDGNDSSVALTGELPDLDAWKKKLPLRELRSYVVYAIKVFGLKHKGRVFINIGDALNASVRTGFSGILVDLFSKGSVIKELQDPNVWERLKTRLRKRGRIMVNVGGRCVEAEDSERDGDLVMVETLKAMSQVFGDKLFVLTLGDGNDSSVALTGELPDLDAWKKKLPVRELRRYVDMWKPYTEFELIRA